MRVASFQSARSQMPGSRSSQRPCVSAMSSAPGAKTSKMNGRRARAGRATARSAARRSASVSMCSNERNGISTSGNCAVDRRLAHVALPQVDARPRPAPLARGHLEHPGREIDADDLDPGGGDRHRDPAVPTPSSSTGPPERTRLVDVERDVLDDAPRPRVVEARDLVVGRHLAKLCSDAGDARDAVYAAPVPGPRRALAPPAGHWGFSPRPADRRRFEPWIVSPRWTGPRIKPKHSPRIRPPRRRDELADVNVRYLGRKAPLPQALRGVRDRETGLTLNSLRAALETASRGGRAARIAEPSAPRERRRRDDPRRPDRPRPAAPAHPDPPRDRGHLPRHGLRGLGRQRGRDRLGELRRADDRPATRRGRSTTPSTSTDDTCSCARTRRPTRSARCSRGSRRST